MRSFTDSSDTASRNTSVDALFEGDVMLEQGTQGYRFNVDSVLLAAFAHRVVGDHVLDVGAGVGPVGLGLAHLSPTRHVDCVERQPRLAALARANIERNDLGARCAVIECDIQDLKGKKHHYDGAVMNPPYYRCGAGGQSPSTERALARHEVHGTIAELVRATARHLYHHAPLCVVYPAERLGALLSALDAVERRNVRLQSILPYENADATLVLVAARASKTHTTVIRTPLILHDAARNYTPAAAEIIRRGYWPWNDAKTT